MILVDSCVIVDWLRRRENPGEHLLPWLNSGEALTCGVVRIEVLRGVLSTQLKQRVEALFDVMPEVPLSSSVLHGAADLAWSMDRKGHIIPVADVIIAQCAITRGATLVTTDDHFRHVPGLKHQKNLPPYH